MSMMTRVATCALLCTCVAVPLVSACGPSLSAVTQTATLGEQLSAHADAFDAIGQLCIVGNNGTTPDTKCDDIAGDPALLQPVTDAVVAYSKALAAMADNSKDPDYTKDVSATLKAASQVPTFSGAKGNVAGAIAAAANGIINLCFDGYRRAHLRDAIKNTDQNWLTIQREMTGPTGIIAADLGALKATRVVLTNNLLALNNTPSAAGVSQRFGELDALVALDGSVSKLRAYQKALDMFVNAHHKLAQKLDSLGDADTDKELLTEILKDVGAVASAAMASGSSSASSTSSAH